MSGLSGSALAWLSGAIFFAGAVDALAGGGGLITLPAYLAAGLDPSLILGTNKLSSSIGTAASTADYFRKLRFRPAGLRWVAAASLAGSAAGARAALLLAPSRIRLILLVLLPAVAAFLLLHRRFGERDESHRRAPRDLLGRTLAVAFPIAAYDGFFGPGTGTFLALGFARWCGYDLLRATALAKTVNLCSNVAALAAFLAAGRVDVRLGLAMAAAGVGGNLLGSSLGIARGHRLIRPAMLAVMGGIFLKLLLVR